MSWIDLHSKARTSLPLKFCLAIWLSCLPVGPMSAQAQDFKAVVAELLKKANESVDGDDAFRFLPVNLDFKIFKPDGPEDGLVLGFSYDFNQSFSKELKKLESGEGTSLRYSFNLRAKGNVAFDAAKNPDDFLDSKVSFSFDWLRQTIGKGEDNVCDDFRKFMAVDPEAPTT